MSKIQVPEVPGPTAQLCWKASKSLIHCDRKAHHFGPHSWEIYELAKSIRTLTDWAVRDEDPNR